MRAQISVITVRDSSCRMITETWVRIIATYSSVITEIGPLVAVITEH